MYILSFVHREGESAWEQQYPFSNEHITTPDLGFKTSFSITRNPIFLEKWVITGLEQKSLKWTWNVLY